jgi:hypothetical protein
LLPWRCCIRKAAEKSFAVREFDETLETYEKDISDPIGSPYPVYVECRDQIEQGIVTLLKFMEQHNFCQNSTAPLTSAGRQLRARRRPRRLSSTQGSAQNATCAARGLTVADHGTDSKESWRCIPTTRSRSRQVRSPAGTRNSACSICTTGVGVSITANKVAWHPRRARQRPIDDRAP